MEHRESAAPGDGSVRSQSWQQTLLSEGGCPAASSSPRNACAIKRKLTAACPYRREKPRGMGCGVRALTGKERSIRVRAMSRTEFPQTRGGCLASLLAAFTERQLVGINERAPRTRARTTEKQKGPWCSPKGLYVNSCSVANVTMKSCHACALIRAWQPGINLPVLLLLRRLFSSLWALVNQGLWASTLFLASY